MKLTELARLYPGTISLTGEAEITEGCKDSRVKTKNGLFFCISGANFDAHDYAQQAVLNGAAALVVERDLPLDIPQIRVDSTRRAMGPMCAAICGYPASRMQMIGITGTKGKTTTSFLIKSILEAAGQKCGLIGTTGNMIADEKLHGTMTTPEADELQRLLREMADEQVDAVVMEVSAHAMDMHRVDGIVYDVCCYTNLSQDHLDYFETMDRYFEAKKKLFSPKYCKKAAVNMDDDTTAEILKDLTIPCLGYGISRNAPLYAREIEIQEDGVSFRLNAEEAGSAPVRLHLTGIFNVYNALCAAAAGLSLGIPLPCIVRGLESVTSVPGRAEVLETGTPYRVILDYSHSPDALENILTAARSFTRGRLIALFGCGGDRDHGKRPMMGEISGRLADYTILTSDNPRNEDPLAILAAIEEGIRGTGGLYTVIENRREAIRSALLFAEPGDVVILAGKGHETYQEIRGRKYPFDEKIIVQELLRDMRGDKK